MKYSLKVLLSLCFLWFQALHSDAQKTKTVDGKKYTVYVIKAGDDWNSIAKKHNIEYAELRLANKNSDGKLLVGKELLIPTEPLKSNDPHYDKNYIDENSTTEDIKYHTVEASQTLYRISIMYHVTVDQLKAWNKLSSNEIKLGQKLIVGKGKSEKNAGDGQNNKVEQQSNVKTEEPSTINKKIMKITVPVPVDESDADPAACIPGASTVSVPPNEFKEESNTKNAKPVPAVTDDKIVFDSHRQEIDEEGFAVWSENDDSIPEKYFAYHQTAPIGTIIKVISISNSKKVYVKVIGKIPEKDENKEASIKISKTSAERLGINEKKFQVRLQYGLNK